MFWVHHDQCLRVSHVPAVKPITYRMLAISSQRDDFVPSGRLVERRQATSEVYGRTAVSDTAHTRVRDKHAGQRGTSLAKLPSPDFEARELAARYETASAERFND